jgi:hypothetical protein
MKFETRQQRLTVAAAACVALFIIVQVIVNPLTAVWSSRAREVADLSRRVKDGELLIRRESAIRSRWTQYQTNALPNNPSQAEQQMLQTIDKWAQESRVSIQSLAPQWKHDSDDYMTLECRIDAQGDLATVTRFIYDLERDPLALRMQSVELTARDNEGRQFSLGLQLSGLVLTPKGNNL